MQISFKQFKTVVAQLHAANVKHDNMHLCIFADARNTVVTYAKATPNWRSHVTKKQAEDTIPFCIALEKDYDNVCEQLRLR